MVATPRMRGGTVPSPTAQLCARSSSVAAITRGYDATLVAYAHTTEDLSEWGAPPPDQVIAHTRG